MKTELYRYLKNPLYWLILFGGLAVRAMLAYFDVLYRTSTYWQAAAEFWNKIGSVTVGLLILLVLIHSFSEDMATGSYSIINSTQRGRITLLKYRLCAGFAAAMLAAILLFVGNFAVSVLLSQGVMLPPRWLRSFLCTSGIALIGSIGYFLFSACVCDILKNQPAAMAICGIPFGLSYLINISVVKQYDPAWFIRYGFFAELMRGRQIHAAPAFWIVWYVILFAGIGLLTGKKRKERKEL